MSRRYVLVLPAQAQLVAPRSRTHTSEFFLRLVCGEAVLFLAIGATSSSGGGSVAVAY